MHNHQTSYLFAFGAIFIPSFHICCGWLHSIQKFPLNSKGSGEHYQWPNVFCLFCFKFLLLSFFEAKNRFFSRTSFLLIFQLCYSKPIILYIENMYSCGTSRSCDILLIYTLNFIKDHIKTYPNFSMLVAKLWLQGWVLSFILEKCASVNRMRLVISQLVCNLKHSTTNFCKTTNSTNCSTFCFCH